eukprot:scaffold91749_cov63-Phaeocystis_antarctica.AAC.2
MSPRGQTSRARPKSLRQRRPSVAMSTLALFRSRCTIPFSCRCSAPSATCSSSATSTSERAAGHVIAQQAAASPDVEDHAAEAHAVRVLERRPKHNFVAQLHGLVWLHPGWRDELRHEGALLIVPVFPPLDPMARHAHLLTLLQGERILVIVAGLLLRLQEGFERRHRGRMERVGGPLVGCAAASSAQNYQRERRPM